jgi:hypothetical protein
LVINAQLFAEGASARPQNTGKMARLLQAAEKLVCGESTVYCLGCSGSGDTSSCASLVASARFSAACLAAEGLGIPPGQLNQGLLKAFR